MAILELTNEKNPKVAVSVNNSLNYKNKDGETKKRNPSTALVDVIEEAGKVANMDKGTVLLSVSINGNYENYFVNKLEDKTITLKPANDPKDKENTIYMNAVDKKDADGYFYAINTNAEAGKKFVEGVDTTTNDKSKSEYLKIRVSLSNEDIKKELTAKGPNHIAVLSKEGYRIEANKQKPQKEIKKDAQNKPSPTSSKKKPTRTRKPTEIER